MKKILLAAAATTMVAGPVAAQGVEFSGLARFGLQYVEGASGGFSDDEVTTTSRFRLNITASADTDFGATVYVFQRAQTSANTGGATVNFAAPRFGVRGGGLDFRMGNIVGAIEDMPGHYFGARSAGIGLTGLGYQNMAGNMSGRAFVWDAFSSAGSGPAANNGVEVVYSAAGFRGQLSYTDQNPGGNTFFLTNDGFISTQVNPGAPARQRVAATLSYTFGEYTIAVGAQDIANTTTAEEKIANQLAIVTFGANFDDFRVNVQAADRRGVKKVVLNGSYQVTPEATVFGFIANESGNRANETQFNGTSGGIGLAYALGGGASIETGIVRTSNSVTAADFGLFFSF